MTKSPAATPETPEAKRNRETVEEIARNIAALAKAVAALLNGPLKKRTLVILLSSSSRLSQENVDRVLTALADLEKDWLK
jgi:spore germination protein GerM